MPVSADEFEKLIFEIIDKSNHAVSTGELYDAAKARFTFDNDDMKRMTSKGKETTDLAWKRNLRFSLQDLKETDRLVNIADEHYQRPTPNPATALSVDKAWPLVRTAAIAARDEGREFVSTQHQARYKVVGVEDDIITIARLGTDTTATLNRDETTRAIRYLNNAGGRTGRRTLHYTVAKEVALVEFHPSLEWNDDASMIETDALQREASQGATFLLTWNAAGDGFDDWDDTYSRVSDGERFERDWSTGNRKTLPAKSRFFFMRQGVPPTGIIGAGYTTEDVQPGGKWNPESKKPANYTTIEFDALFDAESEPIITFDELMKIHPVAGVWNVASSGSLLPEDVAAKLELAWAALLKRNGRRVAPRIDDDLADPQDDRMKRLAEVWTRPKQAAFRASLCERYGSACQISGCAVMSVVQACHLRPVSLKGSDAADNGVLMRIDLHVLFDAGRLGIDPEALTVHVCRSLKETDYAKLDGRPVRFGKHRPDMTALGERWETFCATRE
jgi:hypothetical protein